MLTISREADYAVRLVVHLATLPEQRFQAKALAAAEHVPESFLFKILQTLLKHRLVRSYRGLRGGYQLAVDPRKLTLFRLLETVEGPLGLNLCVMSGMGCELRTQCAVHEVWVVAQAQLRQVLESATVADLARRTLEKRMAASRAGQPPPQPSAHSAFAASPVFPIGCAADGLD